MKTLLVTGSGGLIGSQVVEHFSKLNWRVVGVDNNMRADFFGEAGTITSTLDHLSKICSNFTNHDFDIRDREKLTNIVKSTSPQAIIHTAAQPSHDLAASRPFDDFEVNAMATLTLLEACRNYCPESPFIFMSTNKVYGDAPNHIALEELDTRYDYANKEDRNGIDENFKVDQSMHSLFGASKLSADIYVQEYGRYFNMPTCCLRGGCLTGMAHSGVELHGFLNYLIRCNVNEVEYNVNGYKGKQVRDNIHAKDVISLMEMFIESPRSSEVYNIGGGRSNSISLLEAFDLAQEVSGIAMKYEYCDIHRKGDHICYISNLSKIKEHFPQWELTMSLNDIFTEICDHLVLKNK